MKKNLVIGAIRGYNYDQLQPFVWSLKNTGFNGDIVFLYDTVDQQSIQKLLQDGVKLIPLGVRRVGTANSWSRFWPMLKYIARLIGYNKISRWVLKNILPLQTARFFLYHDFIKKNKHEYDKVFITDVRDVFFQADPFQFLATDIVKCFEEDITLASETIYNCRWIEELFGNGAHESFKHENIVCSGTIIGTSKALKKYLKYYEKMILFNAREISSTGSDQGVHNYIVRKQKLGYLRILKNGTEEVLTVNNQGLPDHVRLDTQNSKIHYQEKLIPVIHQYDRIPMVEHMLLK